MLALHRRPAMVSYYQMEVYGSETASFIVKTYTLLNMVSQVNIKALFPPEEYIETIKKFSVMPL
jgi:hypothetical protein